MKRLFVKPEVRGASVGFRLVESITQRARELGYARIVLDTLPRLASASKIYQGAPRALLRPGCVFQPTHTCLNAMLGFRSVGLRTVRAVLS
jgi:GNAT superfamily N-acetyltransferase